MGGLIFGTIVFFIAMPVVAAYVCARLLTHEDNGGAPVDGQKPTPLA